MKKINIITGRFQPITKGHLKCIDKAYKELGIPTVLCMIDTPKEKTDKRHPFSSDILLPLYNEVLKNKIEKIILIKNSNINIISEQLKDYTIQSWTCGTDRYNSYKTMIEKYSQDAHLPEDFKLIEIKRNDDDISATQLRNCLKEDNKEGFMKLFPDFTENVEKKYHPFDLLRKHLLKVL